MKSNLQQNIDFAYLEMQKRCSFAVDDSSLFSTHDDLSLSFSKFYEKYCVCDHPTLFSKFCCCQLETFMVLEEKPNLIGLSTNLPISQCDCGSLNSSNLSLSAHSNSKGSLPDIRNTLIRILRFVDNCGDISFSHCRKSLRGLYHGISKRRSKFIGVLKNGRRYQVLINEGRTKRYIGTFSSELEAATVHDFYAIGINGREAKTNFSYDCEKVTAMIRSYFKNNENFNARLFMPKLN